MYVHASVLQNGRVAATPRQLEAMIRISEALARMHLRNQVGGRRGECVHVNLCGACSSMRTAGACVILSVRETRDEPGA